jgi:glycine/D-amino acid oxidase-like deaminating enzyme
MARSADVIVVGAGVMGCSAALGLGRGGREVVVVDKAGRPGHGSTRASSAVVRFDYPTRDEVATAWESKHHWAASLQHQCDHTGQIVNLGVFSRKRAVKQSTTNTVLG